MSRDLAFPVDAPFWRDEELHRGIEVCSGSQWALKRAPPIGVEIWLWRKVDAVGLTRFCGLSVDLCGLRDQGSGLVMVVAAFVVGGGAITEA